jgi:DNA-binding transcriptional LysR family regulator
MRHMDLYRLELLLDLSRLGSMRAVAEARHTTTSTVSQQLATLAREAREPLVEPDGRRVRLTPAGRRLADHAVTILAAVETARLDLDPTAEPQGTVRVGGFATAIRTSLLPVLVELSGSHPSVGVTVSEYEPLEALALLLDDELDLALTYDYDLAPAHPDPLVEAAPLWVAPWGLAVPATGRRPRQIDLAAYADQDWIVNSRNTADEDAVRTLAALAGFTPRITHRIDSLDLVEDLIVSGHGVGLLPEARPPRDGVRVLRLTDPPLLLRAYAVTRRGRTIWPPLRLLLDRLVSDAAAPTPGSPHRRPWPRG